MRRRRERRPRDEVVGPVVIEPVLSRLKAPYDRMACLASVLRRVLGGGIVAAPDMPALSAATQMKPPAARGFTFNTTGAGGVDSWIDHRIGHVALLG